MPTLPASVQKAAAEANNDREGFEALPDGFYHVKIDSLKIETSKRAPKNGEAPTQYLRVTFKVIAPKGNRNRLISENISFSDAAGWRIRLLFDSVGYTLDSELTELVGEEMVVEVIQEEITTGAKKGEMGNDVGEMHPADAEHLELVA